MRNAIDKRSENVAKLRESLLPLVRAIEKGPDMSETLQSVLDDYERLLQLESSLYALPVTTPFYN